MSRVRWPQSCGLQQNQHLGEWRLMAEGWRGWAVQEVQAGLEKWQGQEALS